MKLTKVTDIAEKVKPETMKSARELMADFITALEARCDGEVDYVQSGFPALEDAFGPWLHNGNFSILAGRPSMGKTSLAQQIAEHVSLEKTVLFYTLETTPVNMVERSVSRRSGVQVHKLQLGEIDENDWPAITKATEEIVNTNMFYDYGRRAIDEIVRKSVSMKKEIEDAIKNHEEDPGNDKPLPEIGLIVIDFLQIAETKEYSDRLGIVSHISRELKKLALDFHVPVLALAQLNRNVEGRPDKRPMMSDLRESGSIEQDADSIFLIYRDDFYNDDSSDKGIAEIICGKNKNGSSGTVKLNFVGHKMQFTNFVGGDKDVY
jgi:replicative DNA helicase